MSGLQVLSAPANQPTLSPQVLPAPVQPKLAPRVLTAPAQAPTLAPKVITQPQQPVLNAQVQTQPQQGKIASTGTADNQQPYTQKLSVDEFAQLVKSKFPEYENQDNATLVKAILDRHPEYSDRIYVPISAVQEGEHGVKGFGLGAVKGALNTVSNIGGLIDKVASKVPDSLDVIPGVTSLKAVGAVGQKLAPYKENFKPQGTAENLGYGAEQIGEFFIPGGPASEAGKLAEAGINTLKAGKLATTALKLGAKGAIGAAETAGVTALQGGNKSQIKTAALIGGIFPSAAALTEAITGKFAPRLVNSLIKPLSKDFEFGKNPGNAVVSEGIKATTWDSLINGIKNVKNTVGEQIGEILSHPAVEKQTVSIAKALTPVDEAIQTATRQGDQALVSRLLEFRDGLSKEFGLVDGKVIETGSKALDVTPKEALTIKAEIGNSVRWREGIDSEVNKIKVKVYQNIRNQIEDAVAKARKTDSSIANISQLNTRYANLTTAESAAAYRKEHRQQIESFESYAKGYVAPKRRCSRQRPHNRQYKRHPTRCRNWLGRVCGRKGLERRRRQDLRSASSEALRQGFETGKKYRPWNQLLPLIIQ